MTDLLNRSHQPELPELSAYVGNPLFDELCSLLTAEHGALVSMDYSGDMALPGWNVRFRKSGRTLCRLYPKQGCFTVLIVVGGREKERAEALLPGMSAGMRAIYDSTKEGMGQRWLVFELREADDMYRDALTLISLRRYPS